MSLCEVKFGFSLKKKTLQVVTLSFCTIFIATLNDSFRGSEVIAGHE